LKLLVFVYPCLSWAAGCLSRVKTVASGPAVGKISESVWLTCHISGVAINNSNYAWDWIRQTPGKELGSTKNYGAAVQGRAEISRDNSRSEAYFSLRSLQVQDSARYFCAITREQEMQMSFNTNLPGCVRGCVSCGEGESCQGPAANGSRGCLQEFRCHTVHHRHSWLYCTLQGF
uniref:Ig-like domain-containing protein n=1 Tax=Catharus ustulatus TaxID=91951 RepID=A0A8C3Y428_CATUS